jgi:multidrug efflux pump
MCSRVLRSEHGIEHGRIWRISEFFFTRLLSGYRRSLNWVLDHPALVLLIFLGTLGLNVYLIGAIPKGFFPQQDTGVLNGGMQGPQSTSFYAMNSAVQQSVKIIKDDPAVENVMAFTGGQGSTNGGFVFIALKPLDQRGISATDVINRLRPKLARVAGAATFLNAVQDIRMGGRQSNAQFQYTISADTTAQLQEWGPKLATELRKVPGIQDVNSDQQNHGLQALLYYDRATAARLGATPQLLDQTLYDAFGQAEVSTIYSELNQYYVVMEVAPKYWHSPDGLKHDYLIPTKGGGAIPLDSVLTYAPSTSPLSVNHTGLFPSVTISFNLGVGVSLGQATQLIEGIQQKLNMPESVHGRFAGTAQAYQQSLGSEPWLIITAIVAVYIVLGILYESLVHPITILTTLPPASVGALLALILTGGELDVMSIIGIILLIGIVKKNAIMMIDFALNAERTEHLNTRDSIFQASILRFRPILMTTAAALFGAVPLAIGTGMGAELRRPLGISIIGGLIVSQVLTLYTTPVIYLFMDNLRLKVQGDKNARLFTARPVEQ